MNRLSYRALRSRRQRKRRQHGRSSIGSHRRLFFETFEPRIVLASSYLVFDLGTLPGTDTSVAQDVNNSNEVVGTSSHTGLIPQSRAFRWDATNGTQDLGTLGGTDAWASAINDNGQITGVSLDADGKQDGYRYEPGTGTMLNLGGLGSNAGVYPNGINSQGDVVGTSFYFGMQVAFLYTDANGMQIAGGTPSSSRTYLGYDVNDAGKIVGYSHPIGAFISGANGVGAGALGTGWAYAVNNADQVTGSTGAFDPNSHLFRYTPGVGVVDLGSLPGGETVGLDINQAGQIVGKGKAVGGTDHAIYWSETDGLQDLNDLISPDLGWELQAANGLNDNGSIVGAGLINGQQRAVLLTPFSGPDTEAPVAALEAATITTGNIDAFTFSVVYWDRSGVNVDSLGHTDLTVTAPDATTHAASLVGVETFAGGIRRVATYSVAAPGGALGAKDNGTWRVSVNTNEVSDTNGDMVVAGEIGTFDVTIDHEVTAVVSGPAIGQATIAETFTLEAGTTWSYDSGELFQFAIDWDGNGVVDQTVNGPSGTTIDYAFDAAGDFTIRVVATDAHGASSLEATTDITVTGAPGYQAWQFAPAFSGANRSGGAGANWNGTLFVIGGVNGSGLAVTSVERYDADSDAWTTLAPLPAARVRAAAAFDGDGHVLVMGGVNTSGSRQSTVFSYDIASNTWSTIESLPEAVDNGAALLGADGMVYMTGGTTATGVSDRLYIFNPASGDWRLGPEMLAAHSDHAIALNDEGVLYVMGGGSTNVVEKIDTNASSQAPIAADDNYTTTEDQSAVLDVLANDSDADGDPLVVSSINTSGTIGSVTIHLDGTLTYAPAADFNGVDSFTYRVSDPGGLLDEAAVAITVSADGLVAGDDVASTDEDSAVSIPVADLLLNDHSTNSGAVLSLDSVVTISSQGAAVTLNLDGTVTYDPSASDLLQRLPAGDTVVDTFGYTLSDGTGPSETAVVAVTVAGVNDNAIANDDLAVVGYKLETIDFPGATSTSIVGLNNLGIVLGTYVDGAGSHIFTYDGTTFAQIDDDLQPLIDALGIPGVTPRGINDAGVIVGGIPGTSNVSGFTGAKGFVYDGVNLLPVAYGVRDSGLADVNNNGLAVGSWVSPGSSGQHTSVGFTYDNGQVGSLQHPDHTNLRGTWLTDVNDADVMVGGYYPSFYSPARGFVYDGTTFTDVLFPATTWGYTSGINNTGTIIGTQIRQNGADRYGFVFDGVNYESFQYPGWSGWTTLDDVNDAGELAGSGAGHGFIARPATSTDKETIFMGRALSTLGNDVDVDFNDSLAALSETVSSSLGATVRIHSDGRFDYDPASSTQLQALLDSESLTDTFTYTLVDSQGGFDTATVSITVFGAGAAGASPSATLIGSAVTTGAADHTFDVRYTDDTGVEIASIDGNDIRVTGPGGFDVAATLVGVDNPANGSPRIASYSIAAPGGSWDGADNGTYTISMQPGQVFDIDNNAVGAVPLGTFSVVIDAVPTLTVSGTTFANVGESTVLTLEAISSFPSDPADVFTFDLDWNDDGTYDERVSGTTGKQVAHVYTAAGTYVIGVRVIDKNLQSTTATHSVRLTGYWQTEVGPAFSFARTGAAAVNSNGTIYVLGGQPYSPDESMDARSDYLPVGGDTWIQGAYLASNISGQGAGVDAQGRIIVFGGFELGHGQGGDAYVYDVIDGKTSSIAPRTGSPWGFAHATDDQGFIYAAGGEQLSIFPTAGDPNTSGFERYNAATDTWEPLAPLPSSRAHSAAVYDGAGHILIIGGSQARQGQPLATILTYDIASDTWLDDPYNQRYYMPPLPVSLNGPRATVGADGMVYITGGAATATNYSGSTSATYVLDPQTRALVAGPAMNSAHAYHSSVLGDDGFVYVIGGSSTPMGHNGISTVDKINTFAAVPPEYLSAPQQDAVVGEAYDAGAFFKGNPRPTFTLVNGPAGLSVNAQSGVLEWTPSIDQVGVNSVTLQATNEFGSTEATFDINTLALPPDVHAPSAPSNLQQIGGGLDSITFAWDAATDDRGVDHYKLYRYVYVTRFFKYWTVVADNIAGTEVTVSSAVNGKYRVSAVDAAGNEGPTSAQLSAAKYTVPVLSHSVTNGNEFVYAIVGDGLYVGDNSQSFSPAPYVIGDSGNPKSTLSAFQSPTGVTVDSTTGAVSWVPTTEDVGAQTITIHGDNPVGSAEFAFTFEVYPAGTDLIRPTTISTPTATALTQQGGTIAWNSATDNVGVVGQRVYGRLVGTTTSFVVADLAADATTHTMTTLEPETEYMLWVSAYDAAGNEGPHVGTVYPLFITTLAAPPVAVNDAVNAGSVNRSGVAGLSFDFSQAVTVSSVTALRVVNHTTGSSIDLSAASLQGNGTSTVTWDLSSVNLPSGRYTAELPAAEATSAGGLPLARTHTCFFHVLAGDSSGNGEVDFSDFIDVTSNFNTIGGPIYGPGDLDGNGDVDFGDFTVLTSNFNQILPAPALDFGDAPEASTNYPTTLANDGARHLLGSGLFLGASVDGEADGQPETGAAGDDIAGNDEDGVTFGSLTAGSNANVTVVAAVPATAVLNAWVDFNADGDWSDLGEQIFTNEPLSNGSNLLSFDIPATAIVGDTFARFRVTTSAGYSFTGLAPDGEVEDYQVTIVAAASSPLEVVRATRRYFRSAFQHRVARRVSVSDPIRIRTPTAPDAPSLSGRSEPTATAVSDSAIKVAASRRRLPPLRHASLDAHLVDRVFEGGLLDETDVGRLGSDFGGLQ